MLPVFVFVLDFLTSNQQLTVLLQLCLAHVSYWVYLQPVIKVYIKCHNYTTLIINLIQHVKSNLTYAIYEAV